MASISIESTSTKNSRTDESVELRIPRSQPLEDLEAAVEQHEVEPQYRKRQQQGWNGPIHSNSPFPLGFPFDEEAAQFPASQEQDEAKPQIEQNLKHVDDENPDRS